MSNYVNVSKKTLRSLSWEGSKLISTRAINSLINELERKHSYDSVLDSTINQIIKMIQKQMGVKELCVTNLHSYLKRMKNAGTCVADELTPIFLSKKIMKIVPLSDPMLQTKTIKEVYDMGSLPMGTLNVINRTLLKGESGKNNYKVISLIEKVKKSVEKNGDVFNQKSVHEYLKGIKGLGEKTNVALTELLTANISYAEIDPDDVIEVDDMDDYESAEVETYIVRDFVDGHYNYNVIDVSENMDLESSIKRYVKDAIKLHGFDDGTGNLEFFKLGSRIPVNVDIKLDIRA